MRRFLFVTPVTAVAMATIGVAPQVAAVVPSTAGGAVSICVGYVPTPRPVSTGEAAVDMASPAVTPGERGTAGTATADAAAAVASSVA